MGVNKLDLIFQEKLNPLSGIDALGLESTSEGDSAVPLRPPISF